MKYKFFLLCSLSLLTLSSAQTAHAEDCTGTLPGVDCTLDENTTAALTIDNAVTLTIGGSVELNHTIDGSVDNVGTVATNSGGIAVDQNEVIGGIAPIDSLSIGNNDVWNAYANILTNGDGGDANDGAVQGDLDLGTADAGEILNLYGGINIRAQIEGHTGDSLNVGSDLNGGDFSITGTVNSVALSVDSSNMTMQSSAGAVTPLSSVTIGSDGRLILQGGLNGAGTLDLDGGLDISAGSTLTVGTYTASANSGEVTLGLDRDSGTTTFGRLAFTGGGPVDLSASSFGVDFELGSEVLGTETLAGVIQGNGGATTLPTFVDTSYLYDFQFVQNGNDVDLEIVRNSVTGYASTSNNAKVASLILIDLNEMDEESEDIRIVQNNLAKASTSTEYNEILESLQPTQDLGPAMASEFVTDKTVDLAVRRLLYLRNGDHITGISSGNGYEDDGGFYSIDGRVWGQVFGALGTQSARNGIDGYDLNTSGISFGYDTGGLHEKGVMGVSGTYAYTQVDSENANQTESEIDSYQVSLYGTYNTDNELFVNGAVIWGINNVQRVRKNVGGTTSVAEVEYDSQQITLYSDVGADTSVAT